MSALPIQSGLPVLDWHDHQRLRQVDLTRLDRAVSAALPLILENPGAGAALLPTLPEVEISILDDAEIARLHGEFMNDPTPTDVITFHHGEILVSAETAAREADSHRHPPDRELALYVIHGLLHLHGHTDDACTPRAEMHRVQERLLEAVWPLA